jgi:hypothetical protein
MENIAHFILRLGREWNCKVQEFSPTQYWVDVPMKMKDGTTRFQQVWVNEYKDSDRPCYGVFSRIGTIRDGIKIWALLEDTGRYCNYSNVNVLPEKDKDNPEKMYDVLWMGSRPLIAHTDEELMKTIIWEIALNADYFEEKYFGGDAN